MTTAELIDEHRARYNALNADYQAKRAALDAELQASRAALDAEYWIEAAPPVAAKAAKLDAQAGQDAEKLPAGESGRQGVTIE